MNRFYRSMWNSLFGVVVLLAIVCHGGLYRASPDPAAKQTALQKLSGLWKPLSITTVHAQCCGCGCGGCISWFE